MEDVNLNGNKLFEAALENRPTREIVTDSLGGIPHDKDLDDKNLQLKILHLVAWAGDLDSVRELKSQGLADPPARTTGGFTALHLAASRGHTEVVGELVTWLQSDAEAAYVYVSDRGFTPLHLAAYGGHIETVTLLLKHRDLLSIDVNAQDQIFGRSALHFAVLAGSEDVVNMLMTIDGVVIALTDKVRALTPFLLAAMQPTEKCKLQIVFGLLDKDYNQITYKIGPLKKVDNFFKESWQPLTGIPLDNSMKPVPYVEDVDRNEVDRYQSCGIRITGHNVLHLAATQGNAELIKWLVNRPGVEPLLNEKAIFGMTPLHCAIWIDCSPALAALLNTKGVDINAQLDDPGHSPWPSWLPPGSAFEQGELLESSLSDLFCSFVAGDTPLHLATRMCEATNLHKIVRIFWNHPTFNGVLLNAHYESSLDLAWKRLGWYATVPSSFPAHRRGLQIQLLQNFLCIDRFYVSEISTVLEQHPSNASVLAQRQERRKAALDSVNAFLVTGTLLAGLTFNGFLQPPSAGRDGEEQTSKPAQLFWTFNSLSFFFAVYSLLTSLYYCIQSDEKLYPHIRVQGAFPLTLSVGFGILAFVVAGFANVPSDSRRLIIACTIGGLLLVFFQLFRNLSQSISTLIASLREEKGFWLTKLWVFQIQPAFTGLPFHRGKISPYNFRLAVREAALMPFVISQMCIAAAIVLYTLVSVLK